MKDIRECAELYATLLDKDYLFTLERNIRFKLFFRDSNFAHLLGLEKLKDIEQLQTQSKARIYEDILSGDLSHRRICNSSKFNHIENRILHFQEITDMLDVEKCKIIIDFDPTLVPGTDLKNTEYILYRHIKNGYAHFTLGNKGNGIYPETFFYENSKRYINGQHLLDVQNIEIRNARKSKKNQNNT